MRLTPIKSKLEELEDQELHRRFSIINHQIRKNKDLMKNDREVIEAEEKLQSVKNKYKLESLKLKTLGEQLIKELAVRKFDSYFLEEDDDE